ncbi:MAG: glycoside hydrolase family 5 protein [Anaerolineales bacterium]|nr:glycoside hydrolase family 5 protein [Anaerolineales bacterium]
MLSVRGPEIVDGAGKPVRLRGVCVGGWMNMENFINGYPGNESGVRRAAAQVLGLERAEFLFDRWLDYFFAEEDAAFIKSCGANVVRLALNYRHFESDAEPFRYLEKGFERVKRAVDACARHGLYVILDLHSVQGWQNTDWHSDNSSRHSLLWRHPHFQERFIALWVEIARRWKGADAVAGYNLMNEPVTNAPAGRFTKNYVPDWDAMNSLYRRAVEAVRAADPDHIIFLEGDYFSARFDQLDPPFAPNLVYSSHNYSFAALLPGKYPGRFDGKRMDRKAQAEELGKHEGVRYAQTHRVPLWVGEYGAAFVGGKADAAHRLRALEDQLAAFERFGVHSTIWTYKDIGVMGMVALDPQSGYLRLMRPVLRAKRLLGTDGWLSAAAERTTAHRAVERLSAFAEKAIGDKEIDHVSNRRFLAQAVQAGYLASLMQPAFAKRFRGLSEERIDEVMQSFAFRNCRVREGLAAVLRKYWGG